MYVIKANHPEAVTDEQVADLFPMRVCKQCWAVCKDGRVRGGMRANGLAVDPVPPELKALTWYENFLICRTFAFYTVVSLKPLGGKGKMTKAGLCVGGTKGSAVHLPLPVGNTTSRVATTMPPPADQLSLQIYADVPKKSGMTWRNVVDVDRVLKALHWLKEHNPLYADITIDPGVFDQFDKTGLLKISAKCQDPVKGAGAAEPDNGEEAKEAAEPAEALPFGKQKAQLQPEAAGLLVPVAEKPEVFGKHYVEGEYSVTPSNDVKVKSGADLDTYVQLRVEAQPVGSQTLNVDALSMPTLYPKGQGHLDDPIRFQKQNKLRPREFYQNRMRHRDPRFRRTPQWMHLAHFLKRERAIAQGAYASVNTGGGFKNLSAAELVRRAEQKDQRLENDLSMMMSRIKGTKEYWNQKSSDLAAMDARLGPATWFLTLSCAEYKWEELEKYIRAVNPDMKDTNLRHLMVKDPATVSEFFARKFNGFFENVIRPHNKDGSLKEGPLGLVTHYFWRLEYQARGAPHVHMKLWVKDAPVVGVDSNEKVLEFISKHLTCALPEAKENEQLYRNVKQFQMHKCGLSCLRYKPKMRAMKCRYAFPRKASRDYVLNTTRDVIKSRKSKRRPQQKMYNLPRTHAERLVNDYNPVVLQEWGANMDLQFVGEKSRVLNSYITSYVTKAEKKSTKHIWDNLEQDKTIHAKLFKLAHETFRDREIGNYEVADDLLGNPLFGRSVAVKWLGLGLPEHRKRKLKPLKQLKDISEYGLATKITFENLLDDYYKDRSKELEKVSLGEIVAKYNWKRLKPGESDEKGDVCEPEDFDAGDLGELAALDDDKDPEDEPEDEGRGKLYKNISINGGFQLKRKPVLVKTPYVSLTEDRAELFYHNLLQEHVPWRSEDELLRECTTYADAFKEWQEEMPELAQKLEDMKVLDEIRKFQKKLEDELAKEEEAEDAAERADAAERDAFNALTDIAAPQPPVAPGGRRDRPGYATEDGLASRVATLNQRQREIYDEIIGQIKHQMAHNGQLEKVFCCKCDKKPEQVLKFISGGAGVGKSRLIECLAEGVEVLTGQAAVLGAPTGLAAANVEGRTLHNIFKLMVQRGKFWEYNSLEKNAEKLLYKELGKCPLFIIDEISMVSNVMLTFIHERLRDLAQSEADNPFGGYNFVVLGDLLQLPPVALKPVFVPMTSVEVQHAFPGSRFGLPINLWQQFTYAELTENMRQQGDKEFADCLNRLRVGDVDDIALLEKRVVPASDGETNGPSPDDIADLLTKLLGEGKSPVCLLPHCQTVIEVNVCMITKQNLKPEFLFASDESGRNKIKPKRARPVGDSPLALLKFLQKHMKEKPNHTGGLPDVVTLAKGARVMLLKNLNMEAGLYNGAMGTVLDFVKDQHRQIDSVTVLFDNGTKQDITRSKGKYMQGKAIEVSREQFPLSLAYAITIHKSQGLSLDCVVTDCGPATFATGQAYVAMSRARTLEGLYLLRLSKEKLLADLPAVSEYCRLRAAYEPNLPLMVAGKRPEGAGFGKPGGKKRSYIATLTMKNKKASEDTEPPKKRKRKPAKKDKKPLARRDEPSTPPLPAASQAEHNLTFRNMDRTHLYVCFANTAIQVLLRSEHVQGYLADPNMHDIVLDHLRPFYEARMTASQAHQSSLDMLNALAPFGVHTGVIYNDQTEHDSVEFLRLMLNSSPTLASLFEFVQTTYVKCQSCNAPEVQLAPDVDLSVEIISSIDPPPAKGSKRPFGNAVDLSDQQYHRRCSGCSPPGVVDESASRPHSVRRKTLFPSTTRHMLFAIHLWTQAQNGPGGQFRLARNQGQLTHFSVQKLKIGDKVWQTDAVGVYETGATKAPNTGHYYALARSQAGNGWFKLNDTTCSLVKSFPYNLKNVYYILATLVPQRPRGRPRR